MKEIKLPIYGIVVTFDPRSCAGKLVSELHDPEDTPEATAALDAVESMILAHACAGIDIKTPAYLMGIETAVDAIWNNEE